MIILLVSVKLTQYIYNRADSYISISFFSKCQYVPKTLMQKNNMGIIGNDIYKNKVRIMDKFLGSARRNNR